MMSHSAPTRVPVLLMVRALGVGGTERQLVETARCLDSTRFDVRVGCFRPEGLRLADLNNAGIPVVQFPLYSFKSPKVFTVAAQLRRYVRDNHIQIVHSFDAPSNLFSVPAARFAGTPVVLSSQRGDRDLTGSLTKQLLRVTDRLTDAVVVNCEAMRRYLIEDERVPAAKIRVCYNAIDVEHYRRRPIAPPWPGKTVIGIVSALRPEKGIDTLIRAFARLSHREAVLAIVGSGPEEASLRQLAVELGLGETCHFEPATSQVADWLSRIDIFVLPSRTEALSNSLMEAMACGCGVIATRVGGNPELVDDGENGLLFDVDRVEQLAQQMELLLENPARRAQFAAAAAAKMAKRFTFAQAASTMRQIYESALQDAARSGRLPA